MDQASYVLKSKMLFVEDTELASIAGAYAGETDVDGKEQARSPPSNHRRGNGNNRRNQVLEGDTCGAGQEPQTPKRRRIEPMQVPQPSQSSGISGIAHPISPAWGNGSLQVEVRAAVSLRNENELRNHTVDELMKLSAWCGKCQSAADVIIAGGQERPDACSSR